MRGTLSIDRVSSLTYGVWIAGSGSFDSAAPDISTVSVPGRNGDLIFSNRRFKNFTISYPSFIQKEFFDRFDEFRNFLMSDIGYRRLEDSYHPNMFRMARMATALNPSNIIWNNNQGMFTLKMDCKPQHFMKSGEEVIVLTESGTIFNPTLFEAKPIIKVFGEGTLTINGEEVTIKPHETESITLDCEISEAWSGAVNSNKYIVIGEDANAFPGLVSGSNAITLGSGITKVEITPRWWKI